MAFFDQISKLEKLAFLIQAKATGKPKELAIKLDVSERQTFKYIGILKNLGAPINYCPFRETYYYEQEGKFAFRFKALTKKEEIKMNGGFFTRSNFFLPLNQ